MGLFFNPLSLAKSVVVVSSKPYGNEYVKLNANKVCYTINMENMFQNVSV